MVGVIEWNQTGPGGSGKGMSASRSLGAHWWRSGTADCPSTQREWAAETLEEPGADHESCLRNANRSGRGDFAADSQQWPRVSWPEGIGYVDSRSLEWSRSGDSDQGQGLRWTAGRNHWLRKRHLSLRPVDVESRTFGFGLAPRACCCLS